MVLERYDVNTSIEIIAPHAALSFKYCDEPGFSPKKYLVISDLHLGFEYRSR